MQSAGAGMQPLLMMDEQLPLVMSLMVAFGIVFELPLIITILSMLGIVDVKFLTKYRRHAIVLNTLIAAIITPTGDPFNLALMAVPMMACYELEWSAPGSSARRSRWSPRCPSRANGAAHARWISEGKSVSRAPRFVRPHRLEAQDTALSRR